MSQAVKLSDSLVLEARLAGEAVERSIAGQVEFWARLGRSVERVLDGQRVMELCSKSQDSLADSFAKLGTPEGRDMVNAYLDSRPFPHFRPYPGRRGVFERIDEDGTRLAGRFVNRQFVPLEVEASGPDAA